MQKQQIEQKTKAWRRSAIVAAVLLLATLWILLDRWLMPFAPTPSTVEIPDFCGMREDALAKEIWMDLRVEYRYDEHAPEGTVLSQTPSAGSRRKLVGEDEICEIRLVVSLGAERIILPPVIGADVRTVLSSLRAQGLSVHTVMQPSPHTVGRVLSCTPSEGTAVKKGSEVTLTVSAGEPVQTVSVPDLCGLSRSDALIRLWLSQLNVGEVIEIVSDAPVGSVVRQSHRPGTVVMAGTKITLYVSAERNSEE